MVSFEGYCRAKARLFENQLERDAAVLNADDQVAAQYAPARPRNYWFSRARQVASGVYLRDDQIFFCDQGAHTPLLARSDIGLRGEHNLENVLAAAAAAFLAGAMPGGDCRHGVRSFPGVEHRLEFVAEIAGVRFFNDSKATNVDATLKALEAFPGGLRVILGGKDKGSDFAPLAEPLRRRALEALLIGAAADKIAVPLGGVLDVERAGTLDRAVAMAFGHASPGDTVLLSPACASFDQFQNYEHRGRVFKDIVHQLEAEHSAAASARKG